MSRERFIVTLIEKGFEVTEYSKNDDSVYELNRKSGSIANYEKIKVRPRTVMIYGYDEETDDVCDKEVEGCWFEYESFSECGEITDSGMKYFGYATTDDFFERIKKLSQF